MKFYNTLTRRVEEFIPNKDNIVNLYTCGPTVYHYAHIGNLRSYIEEDLLEKTLYYLGYKVNRVMNITDVGHLTSDADTGEDKMLKGAKREKKLVLDIAKFYTDCFFKDFETLNIKKPEVVVPATSEIDEYIKIITKLLDTGYAYISGGNVYFDTSKLDNYYVLTNHVEDELIVGVRDSVEEDTNKKNKADFVLWFTKSKFDDQELKWDSPWGLGYPGWHIECSGISMKYLGEYLDIHCGGVDNIFPHHTNEIAQSEAYLGHKWCNYWFHVEHLNTTSGKMSKSKGEFLTVSLLKEKGYNPLSYRYMVLNSHYGKPLEFSYEALDLSEIEYKKLKNKISNLNMEEDNIEEEKYQEFDNKFKENLANNLNSASAITVLYEVLKSDVNDYTKIKLIESFDKVLSLDLLKKDEVEIPKEVLELVEQRTKYKKEKNFTEADKVREEIERLGYRVLDTRDGVKLERI
ncbi:MAG: cysteine--tRNA ligase [Bacilli bacterium]|nr:cysteine--tRNA ligase [Bacilli bacterium]